MRQSHLGLLAIAIPILTILLTGNAAISTEPETTTMASDNPDELENCKQKIEELEQQVTTLQNMDTANGLLRRLLTQPQIWEGVVLTREDRRDTVTIQIAPAGKPGIGISIFELNENPGDLTVGDEVRIRARLQNIGHRSVRSDYGRYRYQLTEAQLLHKTRPIDKRK